MFVGKSRAGKSTRLNQLIGRKLRSLRPFNGDSEANPVAMKFQYVGPLKFQDLSRVHGIDLQVDSNPDIFLIDCAGLNSSGNTPQVVKQATFALSHMVSMTVLVMKKKVNQETIQNARALFVLNHTLSRQLPGFSIGTTIMMRDAGIHCPKGQKLTLDERNGMRKEADLEQRMKLLEILNDDQIPFSETDVLVLAQPQLEEPNLYWKSIEDFLHFMTVVAAKRSQISGQSLLELFEGAKLSIMQVTDFSDPLMTRDRTMQNITIRYLKEASSTAIKDGEKHIKEWLTQLNGDNLRGGLDIHFVGDTLMRCLSVFEEKAEQLLPHLLEHSPEQTQQYRELIKNRIEMISNQLFVKQCIGGLLPRIKDEIVEEIRQDISKEINEIPVARLGDFPFPSLSSRQEQEGESRFQQSVLRIHPGIPTSNEFLVLVGQVRAGISAHVKDFEIAKLQQYLKYIKEEHEREKANKMEHQQDSALQKLQSAQIIRHEVELFRIQQLLDQQRKETIHQMMEEMREADARIAAQLREERRLHTEREADLLHQIKQLKDKRPFIIHKGQKDPCKVS
jgi:hypothetical protein